MDTFNSPSRKFPKDLKDAEHGSLRGFLPDQPPEQSSSQQLDNETRHSVLSTNSESSASTRSSIVSTATSRSSVSSDIGASAVRRRPWTDHTPSVSNQGIAAVWYCCTCCDVVFKRKYDWKRHEEEFHERDKKYPCPSCDRVFWGSNIFNQHHRNAHGCTTCPHADQVVRYIRRRTGWACGFCARLFSSRDRYFDHVARHYEDGYTKRNWHHSYVIYGLLHQATLHPAWDELHRSLYGHLPRHQQPVFEWTIEKTGQHQKFGQESSGQLQDLLQFFEEGRADPRFLVRLAHDLAIIRQPSLKGNNRDTTTRSYRLGLETAGEDVESTGVQAAKTYNRFSEEDSPGTFPHGELQMKRMSLASQNEGFGQVLGASEVEGYANRTQTPKVDLPSQHSVRAFIDEQRKALVQGQALSAADLADSARDSGTDETSLDSFDIQTGQEAPIHWASQLLIDTIMRSLCKWLDIHVQIRRTRILDRCRTGQQCSPATAGSGQHHQALSKDTQLPGNESNRARNKSHSKRAWSKPDGDDDGEDGPSDGKRWRGGALEVVDEEPRRFACPYFKRNPRRYCRVTTCPGPGWIEIHRVKDHLYRRHALPPQCPRCCEVFETEERRDLHIRDDEQCTKRENDVLLDGFTKAQGRQLRSRKKTDKNMTDADRWREIYRILFPDDDPNTIPNPYHEDIDLFSSSNASSSTSSCNHENFAEFMRREFPHFVRRELETLFQTEYQDIEETMRSRLRDIVLRLQPGFVALYEQQSSEQEQRTSETAGDRDNIEQHDTTNVSLPLQPLPPPSESPRMTQDSLPPVMLQPATTPASAPGLQDMMPTQAAFSQITSVQETTVTPSFPAGLNNTSSELWDFNFDWESNLGGIFAAVPQNALHDPF